MPNDDPIQVHHEGRGGYLSVDGRRYVIELVGDGRFTIHVPGRTRDAQRRSDLDALRTWVLSRSETWCIDEGPRRRG